jgi:hypothetical protein
LRDLGIDDLINGRCPVAFDIMPALTIASEVQHQALVKMPTFKRRCRS